MWSPLAGKKGFSFSTKAGDFLFKPYALVQASTTYNRYDDCRDWKAIMLKMWRILVFAIPNAILGFIREGIQQSYFQLIIESS